MVWAYLIHELEEGIHAGHLLAVDLEEVDAVKNGRDVFVHVVISMSFVTAQPRISSSDACALAKNSSTDVMSSVRSVTSGTRCCKCH